MDEKYYVIDLTGDIDELEKDMSKWSNLPYEFRMRGNDECIKRYGMTNIELYNKMKYNILYNKAPENNDIESIGSSISEAVNFESIDNYILRLKMAEELNTNPLNAIILPDIQDIETLSYWYNRYLLLNDTYRRITNSYSINLFGFNVPNMYTILKDKIESSNNPDTNTINPSIGSAVSESSIPMMQPVSDEIDKLIIEDNKIDLLKMKILSEDPDIHPTDKVIYNRLNKSIDEYFTDVSTLPITDYWFTPTEIRENNIDIIDTTDKPYKIAVKEAMESGDKDKVLSLGWNPEVPMTDKSINYAKKRQIEWLKENASVIVDISKIPASTHALQESSKVMKDIYRMHDCYPIYIITTFTYTAFGKVIITVKNSKFSHAGISLDSNMKNIYTFKFNAPTHENGFGIETLNTYLKDSQKSFMAVLGLFVDGKTIKSLAKHIDLFIQNKDKTKYGFGNILNIFFNRAVDYNKDSLSMVCSQFVDSVLRMVGIDITGKPNNLVIPQDFYVTPNPKIYKLYDGPVKTFSEHEIESKIYDLFDRNNSEDIKYTNYVKEMFTKYNNLNTVYNITDNPAANKILQEINNLLTPEAVIFERTFPIVIKPDGSVSVHLMKTLEREYQEAHRLLITYNSDNLPGIKHELARLFYVYVIVDKKLEKMDKDNPKRQEMINLRARVLNDFKKYMKIVLEQEKDFDFEAYYRESEYYDATIVFDKGLIKLIGDIIKYLLKKKD